MKWQRKLKTFLEGLEPGKAYSLCHFRRFRWLWIICGQRIADCTHVLPFSRGEKEPLKKTKEGEAARQSFAPDNVSVYIFYPNVCVNAFTYFVQFVKQSGPNDRRTGKEHEWDIRDMDSDDFLAAVWIPV